jgi:eukaryotic-like serine/threonine-protein kinase
VQPFLRAGGKTQISTGGGTLPEWRRDGRELFYLAGDNRVMTVPITLSDSAVTAGTPMPLFSVPPGSSYLPAPDAQRFLINMVADESSPLTILLNWKPKAN